MRDAVRILALAAQVADGALFRALLAEARGMERVRFSQENILRVGEALNKELAIANKGRGGLDGRELFSHEPFGSGAGLLKNEKGVVLKLVDKDGRLAADPYYSYPRNRGDGDTLRAKVGYRTVRTSALGQGAARRAAGVAGVQAAVTLAAAGRADMRWVRACQLALAGLCMMLGVLIVQAAFVTLLFGHIGVDYASVFGSIFVGMVLYATVGELVLHKALKGYGERQRFGEGGRPYDVYLIAFGVDAVLHGLVYAFMPHTLGNALVIFASIVFFIFPGTYFVTTLWNMKREVVAINSGRTKVSGRYYSNAPREAVADGLLPVTISCAVYLEDNDVIFENIGSCIAAARDYRAKGGGDVNIIVSDDGLMRLCGGEMTRAGLDALVARHRHTPGALTEGERQAAERVDYFRSNGVAFVCRPLDGRGGKFKKGGNLNFSYRLAGMENSSNGGGRFHYSEGEIHYHEIILTLDKDSGVAPGILSAAVPEFLADPKLAYAQGLTEAANQNGNYFSRVLCRFFFMLQHTGLPSKSLMGLMTPLMGHNAFLRRSFLEASGLWAEDRVSEDLAKAIDAYGMGLHGKYLAFPGQAFTEYVSDTFVEETGKQLRYSYGLLEILCRGAGRGGALRRLRGFHWCDLICYFCSYINIAAIIPTYLVLLRFDIFHLLFGGIIVNAIVYFLVGIALAAKMQRIRTPLAALACLKDYVVVGLTFFAHNYSILRSFVLFAADRVRVSAGKSYAPFPTSGVRTLDGSFKDGWKLIAAYYRKNVLVVAFAAVFAANGIRMLGWIDAFVPAVVFSSVAQLLYAAAVPMLTPQIFGRLAGGRAALEAQKTPI